MKTNVTLTSKSRELFGVTIRQETKTGFLNISDLAIAEAKGRSIHGWAHKGQIQDLINQKENSERIYYVLKETGKINSDFSEFMKLVQNEGMIRTLKALGCYNASGRGQNKTVWCDPYLWVLICMEINPMMYGKTVVWLTDKLILNRIEAGNMYKGLSKAVAKFPDVDYSVLAKSLNHVVFKQHESGIRNSATEAQLQELYILESNLAFSIDSNLIKSFGSLLEHIRNIWRKKHNSDFQFPSISI